MMKTIHVALLSLSCAFGEAAPTLYALDFCVTTLPGGGCGGSKVQLLEVTNAFGKLSYSKIGPLHTAAAVSQSSTMDQARGIFYYVGADAHGTSLFGISTSNGTAVSVVRMPDQGSGFKWNVACDVNCDTMYATGGLKKVNDSSALKGVWRLDVSSGQWSHITQFTVSPDQMYFGCSALVEPDSHTFFVTDQSDVPDECETADFMVDLSSGKPKGRYCNGNRDISTQVYDPQKKRIFGICVVENESDEYWSCWWTPSEKPTILKRLTDDMAMDCVTTVDVSNRVALVSMHDPPQLVSVSLDSGEIMESLVYRGGLLFQFQSNSAEAVVTV